MKRAMRERSASVQFPVNGACGDSKKACGGALVTARMPECFQNDPPLDFRERGADFQVDERQVRRHRLLPVYGLAPGTGLGVSGLVPVADGGFAAVEGEGGHRTLAAHDAREWAIVTALAERFGHASAERALSGPGIEAMWRALASIEDLRWERAKVATEIARDAFAGRDSIAEATIAVFTGLLGSMAGDLALTLGARGGVYIAGGIVPGWGEHFDARRFLDRFRAKGRFRAYLSAIPVHVVTHPYPGLVGVERLLEHDATNRS